MAMTDPQGYTQAEVVTPSNTVGFTLGLSDALYVGVAGNVVGVFPDGTAITFVGVPAGTVLPVKVKRVNLTSTTASSLAALFYI